MSQSDKKIDIKDYFQGENRKKTIAIGVMILIVIIMLVFAFSSNDSSETTDSIENPEREATNYNNKLEAQGDKPKDIQSNDLDYYHQNNEEVVEDNIEHFNPDEINQAISRTNNNASNQSNYVEPKSNYSPYGNRDMYSIPEKKVTKKNQDTRSYNYDDDFSSEPKQNNSRDTEIKSSSSNKRKSWSNPNLSSNSSNNFNSSNNSTITNTLYKASIVSGRNKFLTPENNRIQIRVIEPFVVSGYKIPRTTQLIAYAQFTNELKLQIKSIIMDGKQIPVNIDVLDSNGQEAIEIIGGTGAELKNQIEDEATSLTRTGNNVVDRAVNLFKGKKKVKAIVSSDYVYLRVN